ncbi:PadR family transcriptional regulator [Listeria riparia FSL S10-1204]|nr:PadR family transcriptional regulator [Listeria riparia FSL S10-1204]
MADKKLSSDLLRGHTDTIILKLLMSGDKYGYD